MVDADVIIAVLDEDHFGLKDVKERILEFTSLTEEDIGIYQGDKEDWEKPVCIAMLKTLAIRNRDYALPEDLQQVLPWVVGHRLRSRDEGLEFSRKKLTALFSEVAVP